MSSACWMPAIWRISTVRVPSVSTRRSRTLHRGLLARLREVVGGHGDGGHEDLLEVRAAALVGDDRDALTREGADAARVVEVVVADDQVLDRLAGHELARLGDDCQ